jgi:cell division protein DivIC
MKKHKGFNWFALMMLVVLVYFGTVLTSQQLHLSHVAESQRMADKRLEAVQAENAALIQQYAELQNLDNIEKIAREDLGLAKKDEIPYQMAR